MCTVPATAFEPRPKVESAIVRLRPRTEPQVPEELRGTFDALVRQAFSQRRKTLRKSLKAMTKPACFDQAGVDPGLRPEQLGLEGFLALARASHYDES